MTPLASAGHAGIGFLIPEWTSDARPIANTDVFCFGSLEKGADDMSMSGLSTRRIVHGVVSGVRDYGNRMGIPTVNGAVFYDSDFRDNPLVFCFIVGVGFL